MTPDIAYAVFCAYAALIGLLFGSFLNVCIARMPEDRSVVWPGSACPKCATPIKAYDNVPVLAWVWLRGRCRACKADISPLYPIVEAFFGVMSLLLFRHVVPDLADIDLRHLTAFAWYFWLLFCLAGLTFIDLRHGIIPDEFSIYSVPVGVGGALLLGHLGYVGVPTWQQSVLGAVVGAGGLAAIMGIYWLVRREEGMGMGDVKLLALLGSYFGAFPAMIVVIMVASIVGASVGISVALVKGKGLRLAIPFGPFLALGALIWMFGGATVRAGWRFW